MMLSKARPISLLAGFAVLAILVAIAAVVLWGTWNLFVGLNPEVAASLLTAFATVVAATIAVVLGRYFEKKSEVEAHFRSQKKDLYNEFSEYFFRLFDRQESDVDPKAVAELRDWQRKLMFWAGPDVIRSYVRWMTDLKRPPLRARVFVSMGGFFKAMRSDLGLSNRGLDDEVFARLILRDPDVLLNAMAADQDVTMDKIVELEKAARGHPMSD